MTARILGYRSHQVLAYIHEAIATHGTPPSYAMIRDTLGITHSGHVCRIVKVLEARGHIERHGNGRARRIHMVTLPARANAI